MPKPTAPHVRLSLIGDIPDGEMFSCNLALRPDNAAWLGAASVLEKLTTLNELFDPLIVDIWDDIRDDCIAFWGRSQTGVASNVVLKRIKMAAIDDDGLYTGPAREYAVNVPGGLDVAAGPLFPHQIARKVTLETDADLGRVKGGFYLPGVTSYQFDSTTNLSAVAFTTEVRDSVKQFVDDLNNAPGIDATAFKVVIASGIRHNADGSVKSQPMLNDVVRVNVGRRVDVQRRRANKHSEARFADAVIA